jgi:zinc transporter ZupT
MGTVTVAVLAGASLSERLTRRQATARLVESFSAGVMLAVCLLYLIPDAIAFHHGIATPQAATPDPVRIGYALSVGFLSLLSIERYLLGDREHGHGHSPPQRPAHDYHGHHDHHDHDHDHGHGHALADGREGRPAPQRGVAWSTVIALWLHGLFDGVALYAAGVMPAMGTALAVAIILHKVPEAATLIAMLRRGQVQRRSWWLVLALYLLATPLGMLLAAKLLTLLSERGVSLLMGFVAGSLLHLVTGHLIPEVTGHHHDLDAHNEQDHHQVAPFLIMLGGFATLLLARLLGTS